MKVIDYEKYSKKYSPRSAVLIAVLDSIFTGIFLNAALFESLRRHEVWTWVLPLGFAILCGVGALQATLVALRDCPVTAKGQ